MVVDHTVSLVNRAFVLRIDGIERGTIEPQANATLRFLPSEEAESHWLSEGLERSSFVDLEAVVRRMDQLIDIEHNEDPHEGWTPPDVLLEEVEP